MLHPPAPAGVELPPNTACHPAKGCRCRAELPSPSLPLCCCKQPYAIALCGGLHWLAGQVVHRDVEPKHLAVDPASGTVCLLDLGSAAPLRGSHIVFPEARAHGYSGVWLWWGRTCLQRRVAVMAMAARLCVVCCVLRGDAMSCDVVFGLAPRNAAVCLGRCAGRSGDW